ncbi:YgiQ family radical SAM protein [Spirochaetia bacterium 38H-sp]|uniref:YgiQ family radical SAM protein n=1 Tax=Rarispira pelagica TaxID=3141764 RepID=A0ABU9U982_9SPIR
MFIPVTQDETKKLGWDSLDIIFVTGDAYIDSPFTGVALLGKFLIKHGFRVAIIPQPDWKSSKDITRLGEPRLFWGVSAGAVDSMVANYTATGKKRKTDDYTPGGINNRRPDRATIVYTNLIRQHFKKTAPIVLGGIEASLRRIAHYDYWTDTVRRSVLPDAKADYLLYGMAEYSTLKLAQAIKEGRTIEDIRGLCYISGEKPSDGIELPSYQEVKEDKNAFTRMFMAFYDNTDPITAKKLFQRYDNRYLVITPPPALLTTEEIDSIYELEFENRPHPIYKNQGKIRAMDTIRFSVTTHRGCYGECNFCAISMHQGRTVQSRSQESILREIKRYTTHPDFKGIINDVGGATANMYKVECKKKIKTGICRKKRCIFPSSCSGLPIDHGLQIQLLKKIRNIPGIRKVFVASGLRYDMILDDTKNGKEYLAEIVKHHVSGQLKIAPEHIDNSILRLMGKPSIDRLIEFKTAFDKLSAEAGKKQFLTYYFIAAHPGCSEKHMRKLKSFAAEKLHINPKQIQIFTPTPSTISTLMYYTGCNPFTGEKIIVEKSIKGKEKQKNLLLSSARNFSKSKNLQVQKKISYYKN